MLRPSIFMDTWLPSTSCLRGPGQDGASAGPCDFQDRLCAELARAMAYAAAVRAGDRTSAIPWRNWSRPLPSSLVGSIPDRPFLLMGQMTTADPTRSPTGTESLWAYTHVPQRVLSDAGGNLTGSWDTEEAERFADRMQDRIERQAPGFRRGLSSGASSLHWTWSVAMRTFGWLTQRWDRSARPAVDL
jgi:hypothetical protein